jgi:alpha-beta hydrolase superfamily lysophospholipase
MKPLVLFFVLAVVSSADAAGRAVAFTSADGTALAATFYERSSRPFDSPGLAQGKPGVVLVHMLGRTKEEWQSLAERLEDAEFVVLALDLRGHGRSSGSGDALPPMVGDVASAIAWLSSRPNVRPGAVAVVGASLGANLAALAAADSPSVQALAMISPSLDYRGLRLDAATMKKIGSRPVWMAASTQDPYALRTLRELTVDSSTREQRISNAAAHGTPLLAADSELARGLVEWLRRALIF